MAITHDVSISAAKREREYLRSLNPAQQKKLAQKKGVKNLQDRHGDPEGLIFRAEDMIASAATIALAKRIGDLLERKYPGWAWAIEIDERGGVTKIRALKLSGKWGIQYRTKDLQDDPQLKKVLMGAGELLERAKQKARGYSLERWREAPRYAGMVTFDVSDKTPQVQRRMRDEAFSRAVKEGRIRLAVIDRQLPGGTYRQLFIQETERARRLD